MRKEGLAHWKKMSGYHRRSLAETAMYRFKQLMTGKISLRTALLLKSGNYLSSR